MNRPITDKDIVNAYRGVLSTALCCFVIMIALFACYVNRDNEVKKQAGEIVDLKKEIIDKNNSIIEKNKQLDHLQQEVDEFSRKRVEDRTKAERAAFIHDEVTCLADNIYREAAYEPEDGQLAVATVTMNRVADPYYPKTICGVVYERHIKKDSDKIVCMFSWTCKPKVAIHPSIYKQVMQLARAVYFKKERNEEVGDALLYHAVYIKYPNWASQDNLVATIGQHMFYRQ